MHASSAGNCKNGCGYPGPENAEADWTKSMSRSNACFHNQQEGCDTTGKVICETDTRATDLQSTYTVGSQAGVREDEIFNACPAGFKPAELRDQQSRANIRDFIASLNRNRGTMFLGNWFPGEEYGQNGGPHGTCPTADRVGYLQGSARTWTAINDPTYQSAFQTTWSGNGNCWLDDSSVDNDGKWYDPIVMVVGPGSNVDLGNCKDGCGYPGAANAGADWTASGMHSGNCFHNKHEV